MSAQQDFRKEASTCAAIEGDVVASSKAAETESGDEREFATAERGAAPSAQAERGAEPSEAKGATESIGGRAELGA